jgi:hypothetical protein
VEQAVKFTHAEHAREMLNPPPRIPKLPTQQEREWAKISAALDKWNAEHGRTKPTVKRSLF